jgi:hypothetical protein
VPQNHIGYGLLVAPQNRRDDEDGVGHASRSSGLLHLEASQARVSQSNLKTSKGTAWLVYMASWRRSCGDTAKDGRVDVMGYIRLFYPTFAVFIILGHKDSLVISFPIIMTPRASGEVSTQSSPFHPLAIAAFS